MTQLQRICVALVASAPAALASDLNLSVESGASNTISVSPCSTVNYAVVGELSDALNEGLASYRFNLSFDGGDLAQADAPGSAPMDHFKAPKGLNNPDGFGGTLSGGDLIQVGGAQNTINSQFTGLLSTPVLTGTVVTGIAQPGSEATLVTGSLTAPTQPGTYTLSITEIGANVIRQGEVGPPTDSFWAVDAAPTGTVTNLTINVVGLSAAPASLSVSGGGVQTLSLDAGVCNAGGTYFLLGSVSGTTPGLPLSGGLNLPLNIGPYFNLTLSSPNTAPLGNSLNVLNGSGQGTATFTLPAGAFPTLVGVTANHAFLVLNGVPAVSFTSEAAPLTFGL